MRQIRLCRKIVSVVDESLKIDRNALGGENPKTSSAERGTIIVGDFYELQSPENFSFSVFLSPRSINQNSFCLLNKTCAWLSRCFHFVIRNHMDWSRHDDDVAVAFAVKLFPNSSPSSRRRSWHEFMSSSFPGFFCCDSGHVRLMMIVTWQIIFIVCSPPTLVFLQLHID